MQSMMGGGKKLSQMGADIGLMTRAMGISNTGNEKAREEDMSAAIVPADKKKARAKLGKLYTWGSGDYGRLGHGDNLNQKIPKAVDILRDKDIRKFVCGARHCVALGSDGTVYSWGYGGDGQLGHGDFQIQTMPMVIKAVSGEGVIDISCGDKHTLALTSGGDVYSWGDGSLGQLGLGDLRKQHTPSRIMELQGKMILQCSAGAARSTVPPSRAGPCRPAPAPPGAPPAVRPRRRVSLCVRRGQRLGLYVGRRPVGPARHRSRWKAVPAHGRHRLPGCAPWLRPRLRYPARRPEPLSEPVVG